MGEDFFKAPLVLGRPPAQPRLMEVEDHATRDVVIFAGDFAASRSHPLARGRDVIDFQGGHPAATAGGGSATGDVEPERGSATEGEAAPSGALHLQGETDHVPVKV